MTNKDLTHVLNAIELKEFSLLRLVFTLSQSELKDLFKNDDIRQEFFDYLDSELILNSITQNEEYNLSKYFDFLILCLRVNEPTMQRVVLSHIQEEFVEVVQGHNAELVIEELESLKKLFIRLINMTAKGRNVATRNSALGIIDILCCCNRTSSCLLSVIESFIYRILNSNASNSEIEAVITILGIVCQYEDFELLLDFDWISQQMLKSGNLDVIEAACWTLSRFPIQFISFMRTFEVFDALDAICSFMKHENSSVRNCTLHALVTLLTECQDIFKTELNRYLSIIIQNLPESYKMLSKSKQENRELEFCSFFDLISCSFLVMENLDIFDSIVYSLLIDAFNNSNTDNYMYACVFRNMTKILIETKSFNQSIVLTVEIAIVKLFNYVGFDVESDDSIQAMVISAFKLLSSAIQQYDPICQQFLNGKRDFIRKILIGYKHTFYDLFETMLFELKSRHLMNLILNKDETEDQFLKVEFSQPAFTTENLEWQPDFSDEHFN
jgi:hypothetical protein